MTRRRPTSGWRTPTSTSARSDGVRLSGWYVPSQNGDVVVLLHGAGSTRTGTLAHAAVLADLGYGVLLYDPRGHGASAGRAMDFGWYGDRDVAGAVQFVQAQPDAAGGRVFAVGLSMGGEEAVGALPAVPGLCAVVAEGATTRTAADKSWLSDANGVRGWVQEGLDRLRFGMTDLLTSASSPRFLSSAVRGRGTPPGALDRGGPRARRGNGSRLHRVRSSTRSRSGWRRERAHPRARPRRAEWIQRVGDFLAAAPC